MALKQDVKLSSLCHKQVCVLIGSFFCPQQGQGFKPLAAHLYTNTGEVPSRGSKIKHTSCNMPNKLI